MKKNLFYALLLVAVSFASCKKDVSNENESQGTIQFGLSVPQQQSNLKSIRCSETPATIVITIADSKGNVVIESKKIALLNMNGSYITESLSLVTGDYKILKFIVLNSYESVIYASPLKGSELAYLVTYPLPGDFIICKNTTTKFSPEVIAISDFKPEDFGYFGLGLNVVKTFKFLTIVEIFNETDKCWVLTTAVISIKSSDNSVAYYDTLVPSINQIILRDNNTNYTINVNKEGYQAYIATFSTDELKKFFKSEENGPLIISLNKLSTVSDIDGNVYHTVKIGTQVWMVENLKVTHYNDGSAIPNVTDISEWSILTTGAYCWFNNDTSYKNPYGALYNWYSVNTGKLAPIGWHVPTYNDWLVLLSVYGGENITGGKLKEMGTSHWKSPNTEATNESGFTALPGGYRCMNCFYYLGENAFFYSSAFDVDTDFAVGYSLQFNWAGFGNIRVPKQMGLSIRCVKD